MGHGRVGVVTVPHDQPGIPFHAERAQQALDIALRLRGRLLVAREGVGGGPLLLGRGEGQVEGRQGVHQEHRGVPGRDVVREPVHFRLGQRVGQGGQEHVQVVGVVVPGLDLHHVVLLAQLLGHGPGLPALHGVEIEPAEKPHVRGQDAELRTVRPGRHAQAADQFVLHGQSAVQETDHLFLRAAGDGDPGEDVRKPGARALKVGQLPGRDAEPLPGLPGLWRVHFRGLDAYLDPAAAHGVQLLEHVEQARTGLYVGLRHLGTHEGLDEHGTLGVQFRQHPHGLAGEGMKPFGGHVEADARAAQDDVESDDRDDERRRPYAVVDAHAVAAGPHRPVAAADQHHVEVEHQARDGKEVDQAGETDDAAREVVEGVEQAQRREQAPQAFADAGRDGADEHEGAAEQGAQYEGDGHVRGEQGRQHADGDKRRAGEPVAQVVPRHEAEVGAAEKHQDQHVGQRQQQGGRVYAQYREVLAQDDLQVRRRQRQQQLIRSLPGFLRPYAHGERRDEEEQQVGEYAVQLVEVRQVVHEELDLPERGGRAEEDEQGDEDVPRWVAEGQAHVPADDGRDHLAVEPSERSEVHSSASSSYAFRRVACPPAAFRRVASVPAGSAASGPSAASPSASARPFPVRPVRPVRPVSA